MPDLPLVYIAGPYSHPDPVDNTRRALVVANIVLDSGVAVPHVPHLNLLWHFLSPRPIEQWYEYDLNILRRCDMLLRLSGDSTGADREVGFALGLGIPVYDDVELLIASYQPGINDMLASEAR